MTSPPVDHRLRVLREAAAGRRLRAASVSDTDAGPSSAASAGSCITAASPAPPPRPRLRNPSRPLRSHDPACNDRPHEPPPHRRSHPEPARHLTRRNQTRTNGPIAQSPRETSDHSAMVMSSQTSVIFSIAAVALSVDGSGPSHDEAQAFSRLTRATTFFLPSRSETERFGCAGSGPPLAAVCLPQSFYCPLASKGWDKVTSGTCPASDTSPARSPPGAVAVFTSPASCP